MLTARAVGLEYIEVPDSWLLEPEKDDRQKQIEELTRQVKALQQQYPQLSIHPTDDRGLTIEALPFSIIEYEPPPATQIQSVLADLQRCYPLQKNFDEPAADQLWQASPFYALPKKFEPPTQHEIEKYLRDYESWAQATVKFLETLPEQLSDQSAVVEVTFRLENAGTVPAKSVLIEFLTTPGFLLRPVPGTEDKLSIRRPDIQLPTCPEPPRGEFIDYMNPLGAAMAMADRMKRFSSFSSSLPDLDLMTRLPPKHDPDSFYYRDGRPHDFAQSVTLTCSHFRHRLEPEHFRFEVQWDAEKCREGGAIQCPVAAENVPEPVKCMLPIIVVQHEGDIGPKIESFRPGPLALRFSRNRSSSGSTSGSV